MDDCQYKCRNGWLPDDGVEDNVLASRHTAIEAGDPSLEGQVVLPLLIPTTFIPCFTCNELSWINEDIT